MISPSCIDIADIPNTFNTKELSEDFSIIACMTTTSFVTNIIQSLTRIYPYNSRIFSRTKEMVRRMFTEQLLKSFLVQTCSSNFKENVECIACHLVILV